MLMGRRKTKDLDLPPRMARKGNAFYYVPSVEPRKWEPLGSDKPKALVKWAEFEGKTQGHTIEDAWTQYEAFHLESLSENTQKSYRQSSKDVLKYFGKANADEITQQHIAEYLDKKKRKMAGNAHISLLSVLYEKMRRWGWTRNSPTSGIKKNRVSRRTRYLTDAEFLKLRDAARPLVRVVMDLCYLTGSRQSDILKIKLADIQEGLQIIQKKTKAKQVFVLTEPLKAALERAKGLRGKVESMTWLLCDRRGNPYVQKQFQKMWTKDFSKTDVLDVVFHDIRGKAATDAKRQGLDYQGLLGHSRRDMSDSYIRAIEGTRVFPLPELLKGL